MWYFFILVIGLISAFDNHLSLVYAEDLLRGAELNPIGVWLIKQGGISLFITVKACTTLLVVTICFFLMKTKYKIAIFYLFSFQVMLFFFLNFAACESPIHCPTPFEVLYDY
jgi:hypothetical protein